MALGESSVWWRQPACTPAGATQRGGGFDLGGTPVTRIKEDFPRRCLKVEEET